MEMSKLVRNAGLLMMFAALPAGLVACGSTETTETATETGAAADTNAAADTSAATDTSTPA